MLKYNKFVSSNYKQIFVHVCVSSKNFNICRCLFPSKSKNNAFVSFFKSLELVKSSSPDSDFFICGDFNFPNLNSDDDKVNVYGLVFTQAVTVLDEFVYLNCHQFNRCYNLSGSMFHFIFFNLLNVIIVNSDTDSTVKESILYCFIY